MLEVTARRYLDNHAKKGGLELALRAEREAAHRNPSVMPSITTTCAHAGAGTPAVLSVQIVRPSWRRDR
jgi:hypothetical protein